MNDAMLFRSSSSSMSEGSVSRNSSSSSSSSVDRNKSSFSNRLLDMRKTSLRHFAHRVSSCTSPGGGAHSERYPSWPAAASFALCAASWQSSAASSAGSLVCCPASRRLSSAGGGRWACASWSVAAGMVENKGKGGTNRQVEIAVL